MTFTPINLTFVSRTPDGQPDTGTVTITPTVPIIKDLDGQVVMSGAVHAGLSNGRLLVRLPPTDDPTLTPNGFGYTVDFDLAHGKYASVTIQLPMATPTVDLSAYIDAPPAEDFAAQTAYSAYVVALQNGYTGTKAQWLASLVGPKGDTGADSTVMGPKGNTGDVGPQGPATPVDLQGTGNPEGVVTAVTGKTYRDNSGTNGAWLWIKVSGTGNTGWQVVYGNTGWRNVASTLSNGWTAAGARIKREASTVTLFVGSTNGSAATADGVLPLPAGFRVSASYNFLSPRFPLVTSTAQDSTRVWALDITQNNLRALGATYTGLTGGHAALTFDTSDPWPATLPGVAAP